MTCTPQVSGSGERIILLATNEEDWTLVSACRQVLDEQLDSDEPAPWLFGRREHKPKPPRLTPEERAYEVSAAVEHAKAFIAAAGDDGALLSNVRRDLFLFNAGNR